MMCEQMEQRGTQRTSNMISEVCKAEYDKQAQRSEECSKWYLLRWS